MRFNFRHRKDQLRLINWEAPRTFDWDGIKWTYLCNFYSGPDPYLYQNGITTYIGARDCQQGAVYYREDKGIDGSDDRLVIQAGTV